MTVVSSVASSGSCDREAHDVRLAGKLLSRLKSGSMLLADRGYDADWIRELAMAIRLFVDSAMTLKNSKGDLTVASL